MVLIVVGVIVGSAVISIGNPDADKITDENGRLIALLKLAQEEAILQSKEIGIGFWRNGYAFYRPTGSLNEAGEVVWEPLEDDLLKQRDLIPDMHLEVTLEGVEIVMQAVPVDRPQVSILSSGEITPFNLVIKYEKLEKGFDVDALGNIEPLEEDDR